MTVSRSRLLPTIATFGGVGITIRKIPELIIATYCIENNYPLLQRDRDFAPMAGHLGLRLA